MFFRKDKSKLSTNADAELLSDVKRGRGQPRLAADEGFPAAKEIASNSALTCDLNQMRPNQILLGVVGGDMSHDGDGIAYAAGGVPIGVIDDRPMTTIAGSRSGKSRSRQAVDCLTFQSSMVCIDPKLDLATETAQYRHQVMGQKVCVHDPFHVAGAFAASYWSSWNPLRLRLGDDDDSLIDLGVLIADALVAPEPQAREPHWNDTARAFLEAVILHVLTWPAYQNICTLATVFDLIMMKAEDGGPEEDSSLETEMMENSACSGFVQAGATAYYDKEQRERSSTISTLRRHLHFLSYPKIRAALQDSPNDLMDLFRVPTTWYVGVPVSKQLSCRGYLRLVVNALLAAAEVNESRRDYQHQTGRGRLLLAVDEAFSLSTLDRLQVAAGQISGLGITLHTVWQDIGQIKALYPAWETFLGNSGIITFFANNDSTTLDWIEKRLGQTPVYIPSHSNTTYDAAISGGATGDNYTMANHPLLTVSEIARLFKRNDPYCRQLVISADHGPLILQRVMYDKYPELKARIAASRR